MNIYPDLSIPGVSITGVKTHVPNPAYRPNRATGLDGDISIRAQSLYDLEKTLVRFVEFFIAEYRLDNPTLSLAQPDHVSLDPEERAQSVFLKVPPRVVRGRIPRTVTGEIAVDRINDWPCVIVQGISGRIAFDESVVTHTVTVRILVGAYDENPDAQGYGDVQNVTETLANVLGSFGQAAIDRAYPIELPIDWKMVEVESFSHFLGEITTTWTLPGPAPLPQLTQHDPVITYEHR